MSMASIKTIGLFGNKWSSLQIIWSHCLGLNRRSVLELVSTLGCIVNLLMRLVSVCHLCYRCVRKDTQGESCDDEHYDYS